jgi:hypothetical protein
LWWGAGLPLPMMVVGNVDAPEEREEERGDDRGEYRDQ